MSGAGIVGDMRLPEKGLGLALEILEQVARDDRGASAADIARAVGAPRATVYRVVNALVRDEYLVRRSDFSGFLLGTRVLELAAVVGARTRPAHADVVDRLRAQTGEAVHLFAFHSTGLLVLDEDAARPLSDRQALLADPTRSAIGHLWLVAHPDRTMPQAPAWLRTVPAADVRPIHEAYAVRGYTEQVALLSADRGCLAVPIHDDAARPVGAVTLSTSIAGLSVAARHVGALREAARALAPLGTLSGW
ncbi:MAG: helix-turn-helix domain-containing protein [Microbacterium sp.]|uniref:helix-turn-helix domain-containing protein n=1 Tax=Microbacterium sp. TaxID=51671 RepID=UPI003F7E7457